MSEKRSVNKRKISLWNINVLLTRFIAIFISGAFIEHLSLRRDSALNSTSLLVPGWRSIGSFDPRCESSQESQRRPVGRGRVLEPLLRGTLTRRRISSQLTGTAELLQRSSQEVSFAGEETSSSSGVLPIMMSCFRRSYKRTCCDSVREDRCIPSTLIAHEGFDEDSAQLVASCWQAHFLSLSRGIADQVYTILLFSFPPLPPLPSCRFLPFILLTRSCSTPSSRLPSFPTSSPGNGSEDSSGQQAGRHGLALRCHFLLLGAEAGERTPHVRMSRVKQM
eukprot:768749-Hanusia_phi.AAC.12